MTKQITLEEALNLVSFYYITGKGWGVFAVGGDIHGNIHGNIKGTVFGNVGRNIYGAVGGDVEGTVKGKIEGRKWAFIETPKDKLQRRITESGSPELIDAFNQLENNS